MYKNSNGLKCAGKPAGFYGEQPARMYSPLVWVIVLGIALGILWMVCYG